MFENLDSWLIENYSLFPNNAIQGYFFSGCAIHLYIRERTGNNVDTAIKKLRSLNMTEIVIKPVFFINEKGLRKSLFFIDNNLYY